MMKQQHRASIHTRTQIILMALCVVVISMFYQLYHQYCFAAVWHLIHGSRTQVAGRDVVLPWKSVG